MSRSVPELTTGGLLLRPWRDDDAPRVLDLARDPAARRWMSSLRVVDDLAGAADWVRGRRADDRVDWAVCDPDSGRLVARVGLHHFSRDRGAEIGYAVWPGHRRAGVAAAAVAAATAHGFGPLGLARVSLLHAVGNPASCRVAARCGFAYEGVERSALDHGDGVLHDAHRHARLATDPPGPAVAPPSPIEPVEIAAGRLQLRPPEPGDAAAMLALFQDPDVALWNPGPQPLDLVAAQRWCADAGTWSRGTHATWSVLDATAGDLLGSVSLHRIDLPSGDAAVGYRVAPRARRRRVASDAVSAVSRWAFGALGLARVELGHAVEQEASCGVARTAGYRLEGTLRESYVYGDGRRHDEHLHARLATD